MLPLLESRIPTGHHRLELFQPSALAGYKYRFPFFRVPGIIEPHTTHVRPVYQHLLVPAFAPSLSFIGLPFKVVPFPQVRPASRLLRDTSLALRIAGSPPSSRADGAAGALRGAAAFRALRAA